MTGRQKLKTAANHWRNLDTLLGDINDIYMRDTAVILVFTFISAVSENMALIAVEYEVFGRVQGVFFRKFTNEKALSLGLRGWVKNTRDGTVTGQMEGNVENVNMMKSWLQTTGSPQSKIEKAVFKNERQVQSYSFDTFRIIR